MTGEKSCTEDVTAVVEDWKDGVFKFSQKAVVIYDRLQQRSRCFYFIINATAYTCEETVLENNLWLLRCVQKVTLN